MKSPKRILHLFSDWKWTGPSEPILNLCAKFRAEGHDVRLACTPTPPGRPVSIHQKAEDRGFATIQGLHLRKRFNAWQNLADIRAVMELVKSTRCDLIHVHTDHDHLIGGAAARSGPRRVPVVRTWHKGIEIPRRPWYWPLVRRYTDAWIFLGEGVRSTAVRDFSIFFENTLVCGGAVDTNRFAPQHGSLAKRKELGLRAGDIVGSIVARVQKHRRFDVLLQAVQLVSQRRKDFRFVIVGRGTHRYALAEEPVHRMGLSDVVVFAGYRGDDYVETLSAFDFGVLLVPGSDGSCRAALEMMAMGKPLVVANRGTLPSIVAHGKTGFVVEDTPENLASTMLRLCNDAELRSTMGRAARQRIEEYFTLDRQYRLVNDFYDRVLQRDAATWNGQRHV